MEPVAQWSRLRNGAGCAMERVAQWSGPLSTSNIRIRTVFELPSNCRQTAVKLPRAHLAGKFLQQRVHLEEGDFIHVLKVHGFRGVEFGLIG